MAKEYKRLTEMTSAGGWAAKIGPEVLADVLSQLPKNDNEKVGNLLVGLDTADDAAIYKLDDEKALIQTLDFFTPMVDDPYIFGQIAAANSLSDIYAMGGEPIVAMNIVCFPSCHDMQVLAEILKGGFSKVKESGALLVGGHTVDDKEPKYGLSVSGLVHPDRVQANSTARPGDKLILTKPVGLLVGGHTVDDKEPKYGLSVSGLVHPDRVQANSTARPGDKLILTKPVGTGILSTAMKEDLVSQEVVDKVIETMVHLNKYAAMSVNKFEVHSITDITGFGLLGHAMEMAKASDVTIEIDSKNVPILEGAIEMAQMGIVPSGAYNNMGYIQDDVMKDESVPECIEDCLYDPQTSGGLLVAVRADQAEDIVKDMLANGSIVAEVIGEVKEKYENGKYIHVI